MRDRGEGGDSLERVRHCELGEGGGKGAALRDPPPREDGDGRYGVGDETARALVDLKGKEEVKRGKAKSKALGEEAVEPNGVEKAAEVEEEADDVGFLKPGVLTADEAGQGDVQTGFSGDGGVPGVATSFQRERAHSRQRQESKLIGLSLSKDLGRRETWTQVSWKGRRASASARARKSTTSWRAAGSSARRAG